MTLQIADDLAVLPREYSTLLDQAARQLMVLELYREGKISRGKAAELMGEPPDVFLSRAATVGIPYVNYSPDQLARELDSLECLNRGDRF